MRIWKKIAAGFGVLLVLVLLVGIVALKAMYTISSTTSTIIADMPPMTEQVQELRRHLLKGIKDYNSFFLSSKSEYRESGKRNLIAGLGILHEINTSPLPQERQASIQPLVTRLQRNIGQYVELTALTSDLDAQAKKLGQSMLGQGNEATSLSSRHMELQIEKLNTALPDAANLQAIAQRMRVAEELNRHISETRADVSRVFLVQGTFPIERTRVLLEKDLVVVRECLRTEQQPAARDVLSKLEEALQQRSHFSDETTRLRHIIHDNAAKLAQLENWLYDDSHALLQQVRNAFLDQLQGQQTLTDNAVAMLLFFLTGTLIVGVIFALLLGRNLTLSIATTLKFARSVSSGDISHRLPVNASDELGQINQAMNSMLDSLDSKIEEAHQKELEAIEARHQAEKAQAVAEEASRAKDDFLARMSHEIRTPMNAVIGLSHLCLQTRMDEQQRQYMGKILNAANDLLGILNEILDFSKIEGGKFELDHIPFQLNVIMDNLGRIISQRARAKGLDFIYHMDRNIPTVLMGDPLRLTQVLINLAGNAVKFTEKGAVAITVRHLDSTDSAVSLNFRIKDTGIGMTPEQFQHIFQPFMQVDGSITRRFGGTGIGLSISQRLVLLMNGTIEASSNPEGGSVFSFTIPLEIAEGASTPPLRSIHDVRALIVDDSPLALEITYANLASLGIEADRVESGAEALHSISLAERNNIPYHLVILDWRMPDMDGQETAQRIREMCPTPPAIIMHSDYDMREIRHLGAEKGICGFLQKPATASTCCDAIMDALGRRLEKPEEGAEVPCAIDDSENSGPPQILLVEDNEINQEIACELLKMAQVQVDTVNNGQEAVDAMGDKAYALIFMDVQMPVMDGLEATRRIRSAGYTMPIIAMTAHAMRGDKDISLAAGMNDHLTKPLDPEALFTAINHWLPMTSSSATANKNIGGAASDAAPSSRPRKLPERIAGFNLSAGLSAVGKNEDLYADLLNKFAVRYATITEDISNSLLLNDLETAVRLAHTVKGIAANLGAEALAEAAGALEKTITQDPEMITPHLKTLVVRLAEAVSAVRTALDASREGEAAAPTPAMCSVLPPSEANSLCELLRGAMAHMETDWNRASSVTQQIYATLDGTDLASLALQLRYAVEDFDTPAAMEQATALENALRHEGVEHTAP